MKAGNRWRLPKRIALHGCLALYAATWVWGVPAVHTRIARDVIAGYKQARERMPGDVRNRLPYLRFGASYAILPFVTVNHYEYQAASLVGWGGFTVDVWYLTGSKTLFGLTKWIS